MNTQLLDLYSDYLLSSLSQTTATGMSRMLEGEVSHDQVTRLLSGERMDSKQWWRIIKPHLREIEEKDGFISIDDSIVEKPYTDENELICWHYDHSKGHTIKGIQFVTALYEGKNVTLPATFRLVTKTEEYIDKKGKPKRRSTKTKNEHYREMLKQLVHDNQLAFRYVLNDSWFSSAENMRFVKLDLKKEFIMAMQSNRNVALSENDKEDGIYTRLDQLELLEDTPTLIYLAEVPFPIHVMKQVFTNEDDSVGVRYLVTSDLSATADQLATIFKKRWKVEEYHRSLKQNASIANSPTRTETTQTNHFIAALWSYSKLELLKVRTKKNHYALKSQLYLKAIQSAYATLRQLDPITLAHLSA